jgi:hypothetical protein
MENDSISLSVLQARIEAAEIECRQAEETVRKAIEQRDRFLTALQVFQEVLAGVNGETPQAVEAVPEVAAPVKATSKRQRRKPSKPSKPAITAPDLAIQELESYGDFLGTQELLEVMQRHGYMPKGQGRPYDSLYGSLWHAANKDGSRLVNKDAKWGLREWLEPGWTPQRKGVTP